MRDSEGKVIYVGKASNLRSRLRSYWRQGGDDRITIPFLLRRVASLETIVTATEREALLLEDTLIKEHRPRYNIRLRDDKTYISLRLDLAHPWPRLHRIRRRLHGDSKALYFGPYASSQSVKETQRFLLTLFPLRSCADAMLTNRSRPCIMHSIGRCSAPCVGKIEPTDYKRLVDSTILFLRGKREEVVDLLEERMNAFSEEMAYEKAAAVRDRLRALQETLEEESVVSHRRRFDRDVVALARKQGRCVCAVLMYRDGRLKDSRAYDFRDVDLDDEEIMEQFLSRYYDGVRPAPRDLLLSAEPGNMDFVERSLAAQRGGPVRVQAPKRGAKRRCVEMALQNAQAHMEQLLSGDSAQESLLDSLRQKLNLPSRPSRIECFDISNIQGSLAVGAMVSFLDGQPDKSSYRHFVIRSVEGANDFAMMREVVERRYGRLAREEAAMPDLILIDGGKGQLSAAQAALSQLGIEGKTALAAIAKERLLAPPEPLDSKRKTAEPPPQENDQANPENPTNPENHAIPENPALLETSSPPSPLSPLSSSSHSSHPPSPRKPINPPRIVVEERIFLPGRKNPVMFRRGDPAMFLLQRVRDEAHRFGVSFHRKLRSRHSLRSALDELPGIGPNRRKALLRRFGSLKALREAPLEEIKKVERIPAQVAERVFRFLHPSQPDLFQNPALIEDYDAPGEDHDALGEGGEDQAEWEKSWEGTLFFQEESPDGHASSGKDSAADAQSVSESNAGSLREDNEKSNNLLDLFQDLWRMDEREHKD